MMTFLTIAGLVILAILVLAGFFAVAGWACHELHHGNFFGWWFLQDALGSILQLLGLVLMALIQAIGEAKG